MTNPPTVKKLKEAWRRAVRSTNFDKSAWAEGEWKKEPDRIEWDYAGDSEIKLLIRRNLSGSLCGYVGVPKGHPWCQLPRVENPRLEP